jgi:ribosome maturation factor RimP
VSNVEDISRIVVPLLAPLDLDLYDVERTGATLRITVDRGGGVDLDTIAEVTRAISHALDDHDVIAGRYTLEVSSPGLERRLRTPAHFRSSIGETVRVKTRPDVDLPRRLNGELIAADDLAFVVHMATAVPEATDEVEPTDVQIHYADVERARTVFEWEPASRANEPRHRSPSRGSSPRAQSGRNTASSGRGIPHPENKKAAS